MNRAERRARAKRKPRKINYRTPKEIIDDEMVKLDLYYRLLKQKEQENDV